MKKIFNILTILVFTMNIGHGQTNIYHPFPDSNAFWGVLQTNVFYPYFLNNIRYGLKGDTIINNKTYHQVFSLVDSTLSNPNSTYYAAIREENKRVYTIRGYYDETILYDFNLNPGDTITYNLGEPFYRILKEIDSVQLYNGEYRNRYIFDAFIGYPSDFSDTVIEGIGSVVYIGLFNPLVVAKASNGSNFNFTCFKQNEITYFLNNPECDHCFCTLYSEIENIKENETLSVFPNPLIFQTTIQFDFYLQNATLTLYNSLGQQVRQIPNISGMTFNLKRESLPIGLYFLKLSQDNKTITTDKLIISN